MFHVIKVQNARDQIRHFGCESALWDCFGRQICRHAEMRPPKQSHNALDNHLDPVSRAT